MTNCLCCKGLRQHSFHDFSVLISILIEFNNHFSLISDLSSVLFNYILVFLSSSHPLSFFILNFISSCLSSSHIFLFPFSLSLHHLTFLSRLCVISTISQTLSLSRYVSVNLHVHFTLAQCVPVYKHLSQMHQRIRVGSRLPQNIVAFVSISLFSLSSPCLLL